MAKPPPSVQLPTGILQKLTSNLNSNINIDISSPTFHYWNSVLTPLILLLLTTLLLTTLHHLQTDYKRFLSLGPGGTPATPLGYLKIKTLSFVSLRHPCRPLPIPPHFRPQTGYLNQLPPREGKRPTVLGIAPQRQQTQRSPLLIYKLLASRLQSLVQDPANRLVERTSCFEQHSTGLFSSSPITRTCRGEICHAHPSDGSLHMTLHPADAKLVIENGWGERHPLARGGWFRRFVPREFVLVYAPRGEGEVEIVVRVVAAGVWWVSGVDVFRGEGDMVLGEKMQREEKSEEELKALRDDCWDCQIKQVGGAGVEKMVAEA